MRTQLPPALLGPCLLWPNGWMDKDTTWYEGRPRPRRHCVRWRPSSTSPIFGPCLLWPNGWMDQDGTWHGGGSWSRPHCARLGPSSLPKNGGRAPSPIFGPFLLWSNGCNTAACINMPLGMEVGLSPGDFVLDGDPALPSPKRGQSPLPNFRPISNCGQTAACIKMPLGMEVGLSPQPRRLCVRWGPSPPPKRGGAQFSAHVYCGQTAAWIMMHLVLR